MPLSEAQTVNLGRLLAPRSIAFIGGNRAVAALGVSRRKGFDGRVYFVNPNRAEADGVPSHPSVEALPEAPDASYIAVDAVKTIAVARALARRGAGGIVCFASGFSETGPAGARLERELVEAAGDLALIGPNCYGIIDFVSHASLWPIDYPAPALEPRVALIAQSGNLAINLSQNQRSVPFTHMVSIGNQAGVTIDALIAHFAAQPGMRAIGVFLEGLRDVAGFHRAVLAALAKGVAVVALKAGSSAVSAQLAISHTNSLAGSEALYRALFDRLGVAWTRTIPEFLETLKLFAVWRRHEGERVAFFSGSGGESGLAADLAEAAGLALPQPSEARREALKRHLPGFGSVSNPLDFTTAFWGKEAELGQLMEIMLRQEYDKGVLITDYPRPGSGKIEPYEAMTRGLAAAAKATGVEVAVASMKPEALPEAVQHRLIGEGVLPLQGLDTGCRAIASAQRFGRRVAAIAAGGAPAPLMLAPQRAGEPVVLSEHQAKACLAAHGLRIPRGCLAAADRVAAAAAEIGWPVAIKASSAHLPHKTEAGAVVLGIADAAAARAAVGRIAANVAAFAPGLACDSFLVEAMVGGAVAELIIGIKRDPQFGFAVVIGLGGVLVELLKTAATLLLPTDREAVEQALRGLPGFALLTGYRGRPPGDLAALIDAVMAIAQFTMHHADRLIELDVNPLFVLPEGRGVVAGDALIRWAP